MYFLTPIFFGLSLFLVGVIIFYLFRKQYDKQLVPSTILWVQVMREWQATKWWRKLQRHLLLYLQLLTLAFLMFALTRPYIGHHEFSGEHIVIVFDTSASMMTKEQEKSRLQLAKEKVNEMIDQLDNQKMTLILAQATPKILFSNESNKGKMRSELQQIESSYQSIEINEAIQLANQLLTNSTGEIHVFSDRTDKNEIRDTYLTNSVTVHNIGASNNNLSLITFGVAEQKEGIRGVLSVFNEMESEQLVTIKIEHDGEELTRLKEVIEPNKIKQVYIQNLPKKMYYKATIINEDNYQVDNSNIALLEEEKDPAIYLVGDVSPFVTKVLSYLGTDIVQVENSQEIPQVSHAIYVLSKIPADHWPDGPALILSPTTGGPFSIKEKIDVSSKLGVDKEDSLMQYVDMDKVYIRKSYPFHSAKMQSIVTSNGTPIISKGYNQGHPLVLLGFDIEDTDWPLHSSFPIFLYNSISYLTEQRDLIGYLQPGERKEIAHSTGVTNSSILGEGFEKISNLNTDEAFLVAPNQPGLYRLKEVTNFGAKERLFAVTLDDEEKYISPSKSFNLKVESKELREKEQQNPNEIWNWFAALALLLLIVEWEVYRRGLTS